MRMIGCFLGLRMVSGGGESESPERFPEVFAKFWRDGIGAYVGELFEGLEGLPTVLAAWDCRRLECRFKAHIQCLC